LHDQLAFVQTIAFPRENFRYASTHARAHMRFVHFNGSRNRIPAMAAAGEQEKQRQRSRRGHQLRKSSRAPILSGLFAIANPSWSGSIFADE
jgi:hypothetical protein